MRSQVVALSLALYGAGLGAQLTNPPRGPNLPPIAPGQSGAADPKDMSPLYREWLDANLARRARAEPQGQQSGDINRFLFAPELVMAHQREIGLQDAQRTKLVAAMTAAQGKFTESQWTLSGEQDKLEQLVQGTTVDEAAVQKQLDRILSMEDELKRTQLMLMVRVKNVLTSEQQAMLARFRPAPCPSGPAPDGLNEYIKNVPASTLYGDELSKARKKVPIGGFFGDSAATGYRKMQAAPMPCGPARNGPPGGD